MNTIAKFQIHKDGANALSEDILTGDLTAELIPENTLLKTKIISRESAVICGLQWLTTAFLQMDEDINVQCLVTDGELVQENQTICTIDGNARSILTAERTALNFLQLLSGTATTAKKFADKIHQLNTHTIILDTRKTIPGLRLAQKYAISCGGCHNHRKGLYDALLIKENHIQACGSITQAIVSAKNRYPDKTVEIEIENITELEEAIKAGVDIAMLDNFTLANIKQAVKINQGMIKLEISGGVTFDSIADIATIGVDYISIGEITKDVKSIDFSMRFI